MCYGKHFQERSRSLYLSGQAFFDLLLYFSGGSRKDAFSVLSGMQRTSDAFSGLPVTRRTRLLSQRKTLTHYTEVSDVSWKLRLRRKLRRQLQAQEIAAGSGLLHLSGTKQCGLLLPGWWSESLLSAAQRTPQAGVRLPVTQTSRILSEKCEEVDDQMGSPQIISSFS